MESTIGGTGSGNGALLFPSNSFHSFGQLHLD
jgi:hypothetical protein